MIAASIVASLRKTSGDAEPEPLPGTPGTAAGVGEERPVEATDPAATDGALDAAPDAAPDGPADDAEPDAAPGGPADDAEARS